MVLAPIMPVLANPVAYCNWTNNDPEAVVQECTAQLSARTPEPWMFQLRPRVQDARTARRGVPRLLKAIELNPTLRQRIQTVEMFGSSAMMRPERLRIFGPRSNSIQAMR